MNHLIAILFADRDGVYSAFPVDIWDKARDARRFSGHAPVVAHPPCESWGKLYAMKKGRRLGDDNGCFASALATVERVGGVLEHPEGSFAWPKFGLLPPEQGKGWIKDPFRPGWSCQVYQGHYGHPAAKSTWLYYVGPVPPTPLNFSASPGGRDLCRLSSRARRTTPLYFARLLIDLAILARRCEPADLAHLARRRELVELVHSGQMAWPINLVHRCDLAELAMPAHCSHLR